MIKILIADDHPIMLSGLKQVIATTQDIMVAGIATDGHEVLKKVINDSDDSATHLFDILLLDMTMPGLSGVELIERVRMEVPSLPILVLSMHNEGQVASRALRAGASGYLTKDNDPDVLLGAIRKVAAGGKFIDPVLVEALVFDSEGFDAKLPHKLLSEREFQVLKMLGQGQTINGIAGVLNVSAKTISTHKVRLMEKLGVANNAELFSYVIKHGLQQQ